MRCINGHENRDNMRFCGECGVPLEAEPSTRPAPPEASTTEQPVDVQVGGGSVGDTTADSSDAAEQPKSKKRLLLVAGVAAIAIVFIVVLIVASGSDGPTPIEEASEDCGAEGNVGDDGTSISFDTEGEEDFSGDSIALLACVLSSLDTPDRVISQIDQTRALDGTLRAEWDDFEVFWNYHPDSGVKLTVFVP